MNFTEAINAFFASQTGQLAAWIIIAPLLDFVLGVAAAVRDGTFQMDAVGAFLRKHIAGRVIPIWAILFVGFIADDVIALPLPIQPLTAIGIGAAGVYIAETFASIMDSWGPKETPLSVLRGDPTQPVPTD